MDYLSNSLYRDLQSYEFSENQLTDGLGGSYNLLFCMVSSKR